MLYIICLNYGLCLYRVIFCIKQYNFSIIFFYVFLGLSGLTYVDKTQGGKLVKEENEIIYVNGFVDRVYQNAPEKVEVMIDANRKITLTKVSLPANIFGIFL